MADYHAILKRTLEGLGDTTPQLRAKLFERARATIERQLETANPPMSGEAIAAQKAHLEAAIASIENEFQPVEAPQVAQSAAVIESPAPQDAYADVPAELPPPYEEAISAVAQGAVQEPPDINNEPVGIPPVEEDLYTPAENIELARRSSKFSTLIIVLIGTLIVGGGAAALWVNRTSLLSAVNQVVDGPASVAGNKQGKSGDSQSGNTSSTDSAVKNDEGLPASSTVETAPAEKLDQRLNANGEEVAAAPIPQDNNTLPIGLEPSPVTTTRIVVPDGSNATQDPDAAIAQDPKIADNTVKPALDANKPVALIAQKAFLYEEGSVQGKTSVDVGNVVWSIVQEAPADGLPPEPAIRAKADIGSRGLVLMMTIKRNADTALPASHLIEIVFSTPDKFSGGAIDKVQRFVFKENEEARGEALVGVPATIADGIFLIALNNLPEAVERNTVLMKGREWIDIPLGYRTGRRALITLEKGVPGERVFNEVFAVWDKAG